MLIFLSTRLICDRKPYIIELENGARISTRTVVIATGVQYRKLPVENLSRFEGAGVYYGATFVEAQLCGGEEVIVVRTSLKWKLIKETFFAHDSIKKYSYCLFYFSSTDSFLHTYI